MKPSKRLVKLRHPKKPKDLLKIVLQKSVYEKLPTGKKFQNSILTSTNSDKMSTHFMRLANLMAARVDSYCKEYHSVHGKSNSRLLDAIERIKEMITAEGFEWSGIDNFDLWIRPKEELVDRSDHDRTLFEDSPDVTGSMNSSLISDENVDTEGLKTINGKVNSLTDLESVEMNLKANMTSFIDYTWKYKANKEIIVKEIIMNLLENGVQDDESDSDTDNVTECDTEAFEDDTVMEA